MGGEIYWPNKGRFPYLVNIFFIWLPPAKFWQRIIKTVWIPTIFAGGNVIPYLVNIFVPPLSDPLYGQYIIPPSLLWSIYHPLMTVIYFIPILVNILIDFIIFCNMIVQAEFLCLQHPCGYCGTPSIRDVLPLELSPVCDWFPSQAPALQRLFSSPSALVITTRLHNILLLHSFQLVFSLFVTNTDEFTCTVPQSQELLPHWMGTKKFMGT